MEENMNLKNNNTKVDFLKFYPDLERAIKIAENMGLDHSAFADENKIYDMCVENFKNVAVEGLMNTKLFDATGFENYSIKVAYNEDNIDDLNKLISLIYSAYAPEVEDKSKQIQFRLQAQKLISKGANFEIVKLVVCKAFTQVLMDRKSVSSSTIKQLSGLEMALRNVRSPYDELVELQVEQASLQGEYRKLLDKGDVSASEKIDHQIQKLDVKIADLTSQMDADMLLNVMKEKIEILHEEQKQLELAGKKSQDVSNTAEMHAIVSLKGIALRQIQSEKNQTL